jgi:hypothetical protein
MNELLIVRYEGGVPKALLANGIARAMQALGASGDAKN